ncbi:hypothetical protein [Flavobacterium koreense]
MEPEKRKDPLTGEEFVPKKISQRFASSENRVKFNNRKANEERKETADIDKPLHLNRKILKQLMGDEKEKTFHKEFLLGKGIDFRLATNAVIIDKIVRYGIYKFIYIFNDQNVTIINNSDGRFK